MKPNLYFYVTVCFFLGLISCYKKKWPDTYDIENKYKNNSIIFDSLVAWGFHESQGDKPAFLGGDSIPKNKKRVFEDLNIKMIRVQHHFCGTYKNGEGSVVFEFIKPPQNMIYSYLMFNQDMTDDSRKFISSKGQVKQLNNHWYIVQKSYDWLSN